MQYFLPHANRFIVSTTRSICVTTAFFNLLYSLLIFSFLFQMYLKSNRLAEAEDVQRKVLQIMELSKVLYSFSNFLMLHCSLLAFFLLNNSLRMLLFSAPFFSTSSSY